MYKTIAVVTNLILLSISTLYLAAFFAPDKRGLEIPALIGFTYACMFFVLYFAGIYEDRNTDSLEILDKAHFF